jgi:hypothetical protein
MLAYQSEHSADLIGRSEAAAALARMETNARMKTKAAAAFPAFPAGIASPSAFAPATEQQLHH